MAEITITEVIEFYNRFRVIPDQVSPDSGSRLGDEKLWRGLAKYLLNIHSDKGMEGVLERYRLARDRGFEGLLDMDSKDVEVLMKGGGVRGVAIRDKLILEALASKDLVMLESLMDRAYGKALNRSVVADAKEVFQVYLPESRALSLSEEK